MSVSLSRHEIEHILENDRVELSQLQDSLAKTDLLTQRMGGMLAGFEDRLSKLESSILPIHKATKHLTKLHESMDLGLVSRFVDSNLTDIDKSLERVDQIVDSLGLAGKLDLSISHGPARAENISDYLASVTKLKDAYHHLQTLDFKCGEQALTKLATVITKAHFHLDALFRKKLSAHSTVTASSNLGAAATADSNPALADAADGKTAAAKGAPPGGPNPPAAGGAGVVAKITDCDIEELAMLTAQMAPLDAIMTSERMKDERDPGDGRYEHVRTYVDVRSKYLSKSLHALAQASVAAASATGAAGASAKAAGSVGATAASYQKGSSTFIVYFLQFLKLCKSAQAEKALIQKLIVKPQAQMCYIQSITPASDTLVETAEIIISRVKRSIQKKEFNDLYMLIDVCSNMNDLLKQYDGIIAFSGNKGAELTEIVSNSKTIILNFFREFIAELKQPEPPKPVLPIDGTVHEITSVTMNILRRLLEFELPITAMLGESSSVASSSQIPLAMVPTLTGTGQTGSSSSGASSAANLPGSLRDLCREVLALLLANLEGKAKGYKGRGVLGIIFLVNNFFFGECCGLADDSFDGLSIGVPPLQALKNIRSIGSVLLDSEADFDKGFNRQKEAYKASWMPCCQQLLDNVKVDTSQNTASSTGGKVALTRSQREAIKDRFKNFNTEIDSLYTMQRGYTIADPELRQQIIKDVKGILLPQYEAFFDRYTHMEFSKSPSKYIKYDKASLEAVLDGLFVGSTEAIERKFFGGL
ncbi:Exocyst complex component 7 [Entophlyctis luteolus]|nr:Exocyst complex component 7 [Entophlyctis luteolus]